MLLSHGPNAMADLDGDDKIVGLREHPEEARIGDGAQDDVDIARIEKVYRYSIERK